MSELVDDDIKAMRDIARFQWTTRRFSAAHLIAQGLAVYEGDKLHLTKRGEEELAFAEKERAEC